VTFDVLSLLSVTFQVQLQLWLEVQSKQKFRAKCGVSKNPLYLLIHPKIVTPIKPISGLKELSFDSKPNFSTNPYVVKIVGERTNEVG
jgi:hypothetical protein